MAPNHPTYQFKTGKMEREKTTLQPTSESLMAPNQLDEEASMPTVKVTGLFHDKRAFCERDTGHTPEKQAWSISVLTLQWIPISI